MIKTFSKLNFFLSTKNKMKLFYLILIGILVSILEMIGIGIIPIYLSFLLDPDSIKNYLYFDDLIVFFETTSSKELVIFVSSILVTYFIIKNLIIFGLNLYQARFFKDFNLETSKRLFSYYINSSLLNIKNINTAFAQRNITGETVRAGKFIEALLSTLREILIVITLIILLLVVDYKSTLIVLIILGVFSLVFQNLIKSSIIKKSTKAQYESGQANKIIFHAFGAIKTIKILNKENFFLNRFNSSINDVYNLNFWISLLSKIPKLVLEIFAVFTIVVIVIFLIYSNNYDDLNQSIGFLVLLGAATIKLFPSISAINSFSTTIRSSSVSFNFIINEFSKYKYNNEDKILNAKIVKIDEKIDFQNELYLNNITFKYPETNNLVLNEASLKIKSKNIIGILGRSGSGKSTLLDLISLLITPEKGDIRVDGKIISDVKKWQNNIGYITQDTYLLDESIKDNIAFGEEKKTLNEDRLKKAIEFSQLKDFVNSLQNGVETIIGEKGSKISGGQIQRIAIARSLYRNNGLLILDESTNSLDLITENNFLKDLKKLKEICTIIIVSHKLDTLKICDHVFEIKNGKITSSVKDK